MKMVLVETITIAVLIVLLVVLVGGCISSRMTAAQSFDISEYQFEIKWERLYGDDYMADVGDVSSEEKALAVAEALFDERFGDLAQERKPLSIQYDSDAGVWLVSALTRLHGRLCVLFERNSGKMLALWRDVP